MTVFNEPVNAEM